jgi:hypothetical protein
VALRPLLASARGVVADTFFDVWHPRSRLGRLKATHVLMTAGDALVTVALAGSLFFSISPGAARGKVLLYLALTMTPFILVAPAISPILDRGRMVRRGIAVTSALARVVLCLLMASDLHSLLLFPEAFLVLVASKTYTVTKASLVPGMVESPEGLVAANSQLALLGSISSLLGGAIGAGIVELPGLGSAWALRLDTAVFLAAAISAWKLAPARSPWTHWFGRPQNDRIFDSWAPLALVATAVVAVLRAEIGFLTFLTAFDLRRAHAATVDYGMVLAASSAGYFAASLATPSLRRRLGNDSTMLGALGLVAAVGLLDAWAGMNHLELSSLAATMGLAAGAVRISFDSLTQRDAPELVQGRVFGRFETRFQLAWVVGALVPVIASVSLKAGAVMLAGVSAVAAAFFAAARRAIGAQGSTASPSQVSSPPGTGL